jgi:hypothetical protein
VVQIFFESATAGRRQTIFSLGHASVERLRAGKIASVFELARVDTEIAIGGAYQLLELVESERFIYRERTDDREPSALMNQPVEIGRRIFRLVYPPYFLAITPPKIMCNPPNPAARNALPQVHGQKRATAPRTMKHSPISGTMRMENAPPVTTPVP